MKRQILERYALTRDNKFIIDITTHRVNDLFNDYDRHSPYIKKELNPNLVEYIIDSVREIGGNNFVIRFHFETEPNADSFSRIQIGIHNYFLYLKELEIRELTRMTRTSLILLSIGIAVLVLSIILKADYSLHKSVIYTVFSEGLTIAAWISLWEALATYLINWSPHRQLIKMYESIAKAPVVFNETGDKD